MLAILDTCSVILHRIYIILVVIDASNAWTLSSVPTTKIRSNVVVPYNCTDSSIRRRSVLSLIFATPLAVLSKTASPVKALDDTLASSSSSSSSYIDKPFVSAAFPLKEYTNSIVASKDTNISPLEVYETLRTRLTTANITTISTSTENNTTATTKRRALDVGCGAGVSTQVMWELGYTNIDAIDWSGDAWQSNVVEKGHCPSTVKFYEIDDERFVEKIWKNTHDLEKYYDIIAFNFAVNKDKALYFCHTLLKEDGLLLAPINTQQDYWLKQTYQLLDAQGNIVWSASDVGAWSVQFQPDVTQDTCQGIWCPPFNGFQKMRR